MIYTTDTILRDTRLAMGLNPVAESAWHADACLRGHNPDARIIRCIDHAARRICQQAQTEDMADIARPFAHSVHRDTAHSDWVLLPADFMRLYVFKMADWERPVFQPLDVDSQDFAMMHCRYAGLRGNPQRPVCAVVERAFGRVLEFSGSLSRDAEVEDALYIPIPTLQRDRSIDLPQALYPEIINYLKKHCLAPA